MTNRKELKELAERLRQLMPEGECVDIGNYRGDSRVSWGTNYSRGTDLTKSNYEAEDMPATVQALAHAYQAYGAEPNWIETIELPDHFVQQDVRIDWGRVENTLAALEEKDLKEFVTFWGKKYQKVFARLAANHDTAELQYAADAMEAMVEEHGVALA